jgi:hypothetical protein
MNVPGWDYSMQYPIPSGEDDKPAERSKLQNPKADSYHTKFTYDMDAQGQITAHMYALLGCHRFPSLTCEQHSESYLWRCVRQLRSIQRSCESPPHHVLF